MKLHQDLDAFIMLLEDVHQKTGYRLHVLEKDYYVVLMLYELAAKQKEGLKAYFKGGTALYKALKMTNRFSEDIDISVDARECTRTQSDKRLEQATKKYTVLQRDSAVGKTNRSEVVSVYRYTPAVTYDENDLLQRFGTVKVEATSFTISEPIEPLEIAPLLYEAASEEQKRILENNYDVKPFIVQTITLERIFIDKLFAAEAYVRKSSIEQKAFEAAKHIYDLSVMSKHAKIARLLSDEGQMKYLLDIRMNEEMERLDGIPGVKPKEFTFFDSAYHNVDVQKAYKIMQKQYVLRETDKIDFETAAGSLNFINEALQKNPAWIHY